MCSGSTGGVCSGSTGVVCGAVWSCVCGVVCGVVWGEWCNDIEKYGAAMIGNQRREMCVYVFIE